MGHTVLRLGDGPNIREVQQGMAGGDEFYGLFARTNRGADGSPAYDGAHNMHFQGGAGSDTADFSGRLDPVVFDLERGYALLGYRTNLISIENAIGSAQDDR
ncbi:hypothetical protein [Marinovum sp.]|uniref:hypothetical protein n=1 Tax=Marinovum sp. TaxID=2024839 RepID=UPI003A931530